MNEIVAVRGGGDIATASIHRLHRCGFRVLILECGAPTAIRRKVAFCEAVYEGVSTVEGVTARKVENIENCETVWNRREIPLLVDETGECLKKLQPHVLVDGILAKKNLGTTRDMAPLTIALGPGFEAGVDVDYVIETVRGHNLGRIISKGCAMKNTGVPGVIAGFGKERVIHSPATGIIKNYSKIGDWVEKDKIIAMIGDTPVPASLTGLLRGIIRDGFPVKEGLKIADIDPRQSEYENCFTISDKARCIAGSVLEVILHDMQCIG
ncbi:MAG: selenium-dependent molybdenum cofactor biosynthesis protein YqeB [Lachnospiraceae bacterium]|nr:selenium-dependent molybdenum cofactor biosynthesis protein YqeB [Lachnospiraceae bacterium]